MPNLSYNVKLLFRSKDEERAIIKMLEAERKAVNSCSQTFYNLEKQDRNIKGIHNSFYRNFREKNKKIPSQIVIRAEQEVLGIFRSIKSNKHKIEKAPVKRKLSVRLDKRLYSFKRDAEKGSIVFSFPTLDGRIKAGILGYEKVNEYLSKYEFCDPLIFVKDHSAYISLTFKVPDSILPPNNNATGIDLGVRVIASTSEGKLYIDRKFNAEKRKIRYNKRKLQAAKNRGSKSARRNLKKIRRKEANKTRNFVHNLSKKILQDTESGYLVLEDLSGIKKKKHKGENKNRIGQVPFFILKTILTYKAHLFNKQVLTVCPS